MAQGAILAKVLHIPILTITGHALATSRLMTPRFPHIQCRSRTVDGPASPEFKRDLHEQ